MFDFSHVNLLAILVAAVAGMAVGFLWYSKFLFADAWTKLVTVDPGDVNANPLLYGVNLIVYLVMGFALSQLLFYFNLAGLWGGILVGAFIFFGFVGAAAFTENLFSGRSWKLFVINYGYQLVNLLVMGAIIGLWR